MASRVRVKVTDKDFGWKAFEATCRAIEREHPDVVVGVFGPEAMSARFTKGDKREIRKERRQAKKAGLPVPSTTPGQGSGPTTLQVAMWNEFGVGVPERSFLRSTFDLKVNEYRKNVVRGMAREVYEAARTKRTLTAGTSITLKRLALKMEGDIKRRIGARQIPPPNAPSTIARKGSSTPLVDSGQLRRTITGAVRVPGER